MSSKSADEADRLDRLAARLDELQAENERLREQIESEPETESSDEPAVTTTRRGALGTLAALAGVGVLSDRATAQSAAPGSACTWRGDQNAAGYNLLGLGAVGGDLTSGNTVSNLAGTDLAIDSDGNLNVDPGAGGEAGLWTEEQDGDVTTSGGQGVDVPSVQTTDATTKRSQSLALSDYFPQTVRRREQPGPPLYKPHPNADNPVLDEADIDAVESFDTTDVADPFMCFDADTGEYVIFFEIVTASSGIKTGYATSTDGLSYSYQGTLSNIGSAYPMPFKWDGTWYMSLPGANLYTADSFPGSWSQVENVASKLNTGSSIKDWTPFYWNGRWWSLAGRDTNSDGDTDEIAWHYSGQTETGPDGLSWTEPSWSPITTDAGAGTKRESPAGRPITYGNVVDYFGQHEGVSGQTTVSCYRISELTTNSFTESEVATSPVTRPWDRTFNSSHHIDPVMGGPGGPDVAISDIGTPWELWMLTTADDYHQSIRAAKSNSQDVSDGAWVGVDFDTVNRDWFDDYNTTATPTEYVVPNSGLYRVYVQVGWNTSVDGAWFKLRLRKNGSSTLARRDVTAGQVRQHFPNLEYEDEFVAGDTITVESQIDNVSSGTYTIQGFKSWTYLLIERKR